MGKLCGAVQVESIYIPEQMVLTKDSQRVTAVLEDINAYIEPVSEEVIVEFKTGMWTFIQVAYMEGLVTITGMMTVNDWPQAIAHAVTLATTEPQWRHVVGFFLGLNIDVPESEEWVIAIAENCDVPLKEGWTYY